MLKLFICIVDAELFEAVDVKSFKPEEKYKVKLKTTISGELQSINREMNSKASVQKQTRKCRAHQ